LRYGLASKGGIDKTTSLSWGPLCSAYPGNRCPSRRHQTFQLWLCGSCHWLMELEFPAIEIGV